MPKESDIDGNEDGRCLLVMGCTFLVIGLCCIVAGAVLTGLAFASDDSGTSVKQIVGPIALGLGAVGVMASIAYMCCYCRTYTEDHYSTSSDGTNSKRPSVKPSRLSGNYFVGGSRKEFIHVHHPSSKTHSPNTSQETLPEEEVHERPRGRHRHHMFHHSHRDHGHNDGEQLFHEVAALEQYLSNNPTLRQRWEEMAARLRCRPQMKDKLAHFHKKLAVDPEALARLVNVMKAYVEDPDECEHQIIYLVDQYSIDRPVHRQERRASFPPPGYTMHSPGHSVFVADQSPYADTSYSPPPPQHTAPQHTAYPDFVHPGTAVYDEMAYPAATSAYQPQDVFWIPTTSYPVVWENSYPSEFYA